MTPKPVIYIVPGSWHSASVYCTLEAHLQAAGYPTICHSLPGLDPRDPEAASCAADTAFVREKLESILDRGRSVVVLAHSYGAVCGFAAATGLSKTDRAAQGKEAGVIGLISVAGSLVHEGKSISETFLETIDPDDPPAEYSALDEASPGLVELTDSLPMLDGVPNALASAAKAALGTEAKGSLFGSSPPPAWKDDAFQGRLAYVIPKRDRAITPSMQLKQIESTGVKWKTAELDTGHGVFLSMPQELSEIVQKWCDEFGKM